MNRAILMAMALVVAGCSDSGATATNAKEEAENTSPPEHVVFKLYKAQMKAGARATGSGDRLLDYRNIKCKPVRAMTELPAPVWRCLLDVQWQQNGWHEKTHIMVTFHQNNWRPMPKDWKLF